jgi:hypothetical protein
VIDELKESLESIERWFKEYNEKKW